MRAILWHKVWRDLWKNRTRTILVVLTIAVGSFAIGLAGSVLQELMQTLNGSYLTSNPPHGIIFSASDQGFDEQALQTVRNIDDVQVVEGRSVLITRAKIESDEWQDFILFVIPDFEGSQIAQVQPVAGAWPPPTGTILLERAGFNELHVAEGDSLTIHTSDGTEHTLQVSGSVQDPSRGSLTIGDPAAGYITLGTLKMLGQSTALTELLFRLDEEKPDQSHVLEVMDQSRTLLQQRGYAMQDVHPGKYREHPFTDSIRTITLVLGVLGGFALLMTGSLVVNTMGSVLTQEVRQIGVLKALGARRSQIVNLYLRLVIAHGLLALLLSIPLTYVTGLALTTFLGNLFNADINNFHIPLSVITFQILASLLLPSLFTLRTVIIGTRGSVREALTDYGLSLKTGRNRFIRTLSTIAQKVGKVNHLPVWLQFCLRNVFRRRNRALFTFVTLLLSGLLFETVFSLHASQMRQLDFNLAPFAYDVQIELSQPVQLARVKSILSNLEGVMTMEGWSVTGGTVIGDAGTGNNRLRVTALPVDTVMMSFTVIEGRWLQPGDQNAIVVDGFAQLDNQELTVGSDVALGFDQQKTIWHVVGVVERIQQPGAYVTNNEYWQQTGNPDSIDTVYLRLKQHDEKTQLTLARKAEQELVADGLAISAVRTASEVRDTEARGFHLIRMFLLSMVLVVSIIGGLGLAGTLAINVVERTREIGILRALGASNSTIARIILIEALLLSVIAWLVSTLFSIPVSSFLIYVIELLTDEPLPYTFATASLLGWLGIMLFLASLASIVPARNATRIAVREALIYE